MQKKLLALAIASLASTGAFAQSSVTLYGSFDAGIRSVDNANAAGQSKLTMDSSGTYNSNRWGIKGSEDMGGGMKANFNLEGAFNTGTGNINTDATGAIFARKATVGLSGPWGSLDLGRNYTTIFYTTGAYDPFKYKWTGIIPIAGLDGARRNNDIQFTSNSMNGLVFRLERAVGEQLDTMGGSATTEVGLSYAAGPISFGTAYGTQANAADTLNTTNFTVGGKYAMGAAELMVGYDIKKAEAATGPSADTKVTWLGGRLALSPTSALSAAVYQTKTENVAASAGEKQTLMFGFVHNLSKRTEFYASIDAVSLDGSLVMGFGTATTQNKATGFTVGINHTF